MMRSLLDMAKTSAKATARADQSGDSKHLTNRASRVARRLRNASLTPEQTESLNALFDQIESMLPASRRGAPSKWGEERLRRLLRLVDKAKLVEGVAKDSDLAKRITHPKTLRNLISKARKLPS